MPATAGSISAERPARPSAEPPADPSAPARANPARLPTLWTIDPLAIGLWLAAQLAGLALALLHVPLAASYPPGERLGVELLTAVQIGSAALLAPALSRSLGTTAVAIATVWPTVLLAGALAARPVPAALLAAAVVSVWVAGLALWSAACRSRALQGMLAAVSSVVGIGGGLAAYLATEFGPAADSGSAVATAATDAWATALDFGPIALAWRAAQIGTVEVSQASPLIVFLFVGLLLMGVRRYRHARRSSAKAIA